jgi:sugar phosphate permease
MGPRLDAMNLGVVLALSTALAYGAAHFIGGVGSRRHSSWRVVLVGQAAGALVMLAAGLAVTVLLAAGVLGERIGTGQRVASGSAPSQLPRSLRAEPDQPKAGART